jgi:hypothetical protein
MTALCAHCPAERARYMPSVILHDNDCPVVADIHLSSCRAEAVGFCNCHTPQAATS